MNEQEEKDWIKRIKCKLAYYRDCSFNPEDCTQVRCVYNKNYSKT